MSGQKCPVENVQSKMSSRKFPVCRPVSTVQFIIPILFTMECLGFEIMVNMCFRDLREHCAYQNQFRVSRFAWLSIARTNRKWVLAEGVQLLVRFALKWTVFEIWRNMYFARNVKWEENMTFFYITCVKRETRKAESYFPFPFECEKTGQNWYWTKKKWTTLKGI